MLEETFYVHDLLQIQTCLELNELSLDASEREHETTSFDYSSDVLCTNYSDLSFVYEDTEIHTLRFLA